MIGSVKAKYIDKIMALGPLCGGLSHFSLILLQFRHIFGRGNGAQTYLGKNNEISTYVEYITQKLKSRIAHTIILVNIGYGI